MEPSEVSTTFSLPVSGHAERCEAVAAVRADRGFGFWFSNARAFNLRPMIGRARRGRPTPAVQP